MENNTNNESEKSNNDSSNSENNLKTEKEIKIEDNNKKEDEIKNDKEENENENKINNQNEIEQKDEDKQIINEKKEEIKEEKKGEEEEKTTSEYIIRCDKCFLVPVIKLDHSTYKIHCQCENNHIKSNILISQALKESKSISTKLCSSCNEKSEEDNYFCLQCQKIFCLDNGCKKKHTKEQPNHKLININNLDNSCLEHSTSFSKYCKDCKKNICVKCQREIHSNHRLIDLGEILPLDEEIERAKKLFEVKEKKLLAVKKSINDWLDELNIKINSLLDSIEGEILINKNILKNFKTDLMNYQMIENFNYFSDAENLDFYTNKELIDLAREESWIHKTFLITQILNNLEKPMQVIEQKEEEKVKKKEDKKEDKKEEKKSNLKNNNKNKKVIINDDNNVNNKPKHDVLSKSTTITFKNIEKENLNISKNAHSLKIAKTFSPSQIFVNDHYKSLTDITNINISKKVFKSNVNIKENIYSALIDNKGIIFLGGESCLNIYRLDLKSNKIENEFAIKHLDGKINTIEEIKDNYLIIGSSKGTIRIIEFLGNKKYRIHQEIRNQDRNSIYKIIELSNYDLVSCDERNIILYHLKKNFYDLIQEIKLDSPTCCVLQISKNIIAATHVVLQTISFYEIGKGKLSLKKEIEKIDSTVNNTSMAIINDDYFCLISKKILYIFNIDKLDLSKKIELQMSMSILFPISFDKLLFCHDKENEKGKIDTSLSLKTFDEKSINFNDVEQNVVSKGKDKEAEDNIYYINFFEPNMMILISKNNISYWG